LHAAVTAAHNKGFFPGGGGLGGRKKILRMFTNKRFTTVLPYILVFGCFVVAYDKSTEYSSWTFGNAELSSNMQDQKKPRSVLLIRQQLDGGQLLLLRKE
jgi:hypothetical protein